MTKKNHNSYNQCSFCGRNIIDLPFKCHYCHKTFCSDHRLPEEHHCKTIKKVQVNSQKNWQKSIQSSLLRPVKKPITPMTIPRKVNRQFKKFDYKKRKTLKKILKILLVLAVVYFAYSYYVNNKTGINDFFSNFTFNTLSTNYSSYQINPKTVNLYRVGEFTVYQGVNDYLANQERSISYYYTPPTTKDFIMRDLDNKIQQFYLDSLVIKIKNLTNDPNEQARISIRLVQNIPYDWSAFNTNNVEGRYSYEVLYDMEGVCMEKADLMAYLLRGMGFGVAIFEYNKENHRAVGIKCNNGNYRSNYCFIEPTDIYPISQIPSDYVGGADIKNANPEIIVISDGMTYLP